MLSKKDKESIRTIFQEELKEALTIYVDYEKHLDDDGVPLPPALHRSGLPDVRYAQPDFQPSELPEPSEIPLPAAGFGRTVHAEGLQDSGHMAYAECCHADRANGQPPPA